MAGGTELMVRGPDPFEERGLFGAGSLGRAASAIGGVAVASALGGEAFSSGGVHADFLFKRRDR